MRCDLSKISDVFWQSYTTDKTLFLFIILFISVIIILMIEGIWIFYHNKEGNFTTTYINAKNHFKKGDRIMINGEEYTIKKVFSDRITIRKPGWTQSTGKTQSTGPKI